MGKDIAKFAVFGPMGLSFAGPVSQVQAAQETKKLARKQQEAQEAQQLLQQRIEEARIRRTKRIRAAQLYAQSGGVTSAATEGAIIGAETQARFQTDIIQEQGAAQREQFALQKSMTSSQANAQIGQAIGSFTNTLFSIGGMG